MDKRGELFKNLFLVSSLIVMIVMSVYITSGRIVVGETTGQNSTRWGVGPIGTGNDTRNNEQLTVDSTGIINTSMLNTGVVYIYRPNASEIWLNAGNFTVNFTITNRNTTTQAGAVEGGEVLLTHINISAYYGWANENITNVSVASTVANATNFSDYTSGNYTMQQLNVDTEYYNSTGYAANRGFTFGNLTGWTDSNSTAIGIRENDSIQVWFNITTTTTAVEYNITWVIDLWNYTNGSNSTAYSDDAKMGHKQINLTSGGIDTLGPRLSELNITDGWGNVLKVNDATYNLNGSNDYLRNGTGVTETLLNVSVIIEDLNIDATNVTLYINNNSFGVNYSGGAMTLSGSNRGTMAILMTNYANNSWSKRLFNATINATQLGMGHNNRSTFTIFTTDYLNNSILAPANNTGVGFNFTTDAVNPTATITMPSVTNIDTSGSIKLICAGSDSESGISSTTLKITKPGSGTVISTTETTHTFTGDDTNEAGTYTVDCDVTDTVGLTGGAVSQTFTTQYGGGGEAPSAGEGPSADISITEPTGESTTTAQEGSIKTFTLDGTTMHKITFLKVTTSSVTLKIESNPVEITLNIGETKEVDIDGDGNIDIEVKLNSITDGVADISVKKVGLPAGEVAPEEIEEEAAPEEVIEAPSRVGLVVAIIIIIVVVIAVVYFLTKKKKK